MKNESAYSYGRALRIGANLLPDVYAKPTVQSNFARFPGLYFGVLVKDFHTRKASSMEWLDTELDDICSKICLPAKQLNDEEQADFWLGYYQESKRIVD